MSKQTEAQRLADVLPQFGGATCYQAAAELLRQEALIAELAGALRYIDSAMYMDDAGQMRMARSFDETLIGAALAKVQQ